MQNESHPSLNLYILKYVYTEWFGSCWTSDRSVCFSLISRRRLHIEQDRDTEI